MRKIEKHFIESFPSEKQELIRNWMSENENKFDRLDLLTKNIGQFILNDARRTWNHVRLFFNNK